MDYLFFLLPPLPRRHFALGKERQASQMVASEIDQHIFETQIPARTLGIRFRALGYLPRGDPNPIQQVQASSEKDFFLELEAPLDRNTNVHGAAFAGSLYSVAALTSYYLGRHWMMRLSPPLPTEEKDWWKPYILVAKSATIRYRKPVRSDWIVARSILPPPEELTAFRETLATKGKATTTVSGRIALDLEDTGSAAPVIACEYDVVLCAYLPKG